MGRDVDDDGGNTPHAAWEAAVGETRDGAVVAVVDNRHLLLQGDSKFDGTTDTLVNIVAQIKVPVPRRDFELVLMWDNESHAKKKKKE